MAKEFRYHRQGPRLEFYTDIYDFSEQHPAVADGEQPPLRSSLTIIGENEPLDFAPGEPDIRGFAVNTPNGNTLGMIQGFLIDTMQVVVPYAYVLTLEACTVVVPTNQFMLYPDTQAGNIGRRFGSTAERAERPRERRRCRARRSLLERLPARERRVTTAPIPRASAGLRAARPVDR